MTQIKVPPQNKKENVAFLFDVLCTLKLVWLVTYEFLICQTTLPTPHSTQKGGGEESGFLFFLLSFS